VVRGVGGSLIQGAPIDGDAEVQRRARERRRARWVEGTPLAERGKAWKMAPRVAGPYWLAIDVR
jgi:hypothetical protein